MNKLISNASKKKKLSINSKITELNEIQNDQVPIWMEFENFKAGELISNSEQINEPKESSCLLATDTSQNTSESDSVKLDKTFESPLDINSETVSSNLTFSDLDSQEEIILNNREKSPVISSTMSLKNEPDDGMKTKG